MPGSIEDIDVEQRAEVFVERLAFTPCRVPEERRYLFQTTKHR